MRMGGWSDPPMSSIVCHGSRFVRVVGAGNMSGLLGFPFERLCVVDAVQACKV